MSSGRGTLEDTIWMFMAKIREVSIIKPEKKLSKTKFRKSRDLMGFIRPAKKN